MNFQSTPSLFSTCIRIRIFVPTTHFHEICETLERLACTLKERHLSVGTLGCYDSVRYKTITAENYIPNKARGAKPFQEAPPDVVCIETWCSPGSEAVVALKLREAHPYEHPVIEMATVSLVNPKIT